MKTFAKTLPTLCWVIIVLATCIVFDDIILAFIPQIPGLIYSYLIPFWIGETIVIIILSGVWWLRTSGANTIITNTKVGPLHKE